MKKPMLLTVVAAFALLSFMVPVPVRQAAHAQGTTPKDIVQPTVFQAAGPTVESIQGTVDEFRAALGDPTTAMTQGRSPGGRREINWDGGGHRHTTAPVTPFDVFLDTRGGQFTTPGTGLSQAPPRAGPRAASRAFRQPDLRRDLQHLQPLASVHPGWQQHHRGFFFVPGTNGGQEFLTQQRSRALARSSPMLTNPMERPSQIEDRGPAR